MSKQVVRTPFHDLHDFIEERYLQVKLMAELDVEKRIPIREKFMKLMGNWVYEFGILADSVTTQSKILNSTKQVLPPINDKSILRRAEQLLQAISEVKPVRTLATPLQEPMIESGNILLTCQDVYLQRFSVINALYQRLINETQSDEYTDGLHQVIVTLDCLPSNGKSSEKTGKGGRKNLADSKPGLVALYRLLQKHKKQSQGPVKLVKNLKNDAEVINALQVAGERALTEELVKAAIRWCDSNA